jgi:hypothetical protein
LTEAEWFDLLRMAEDGIADREALARGEVAQVVLDKNGVAWQKRTEWCMTPGHDHCTRWFSTMGEEQHSAPDPLGGAS